MANALYSSRSFRNVKKRIGSIVAGKKDPKALSTCHLVSSVSNLGSKQHHEDTLILMADVYEEH
jgi:hypothetical protein